MTFIITVLTDDHAQLIVSETRTTDGAIVDMLMIHYRNQGYLVRMRSVG